MGATDVHRIGLELSRTLGPLRRALTRATRIADGLPDIPDAQIEVLRLLAEEGPSTAGALAARLGLAAPTLSNLLTAMSASGLVARTRDADDRRRVLVTASEHALTLLVRYDQTATAILDRYVATLPPAERRAVAAALPVLGRMVDGLAP